MKRIKILGQKILGLTSYLAARWWGRLILIALPIFIAFSHLLLGYNVIATLDATNVTYPSMSFYQYALKNNLNIFINPFNLSGAASYAGMFIGFLSPVNYLFFKYLPVGLAYSWLMALYLTLAGFFTAQLAKELKCSPLASLIAGYAFILACNYNDMSVYAAGFWLALIFWFLTYIYNHNSWLLTILGGAIAGIGWLTGHSNLMIIATVGFLIYTIFLIISSKKYYLIPKFLILFFLYFIVGSIQIISSLIYVSISGRGGDFFHQTAAVSTLGLGSIINLAFPLIQRLLSGGFFINYIGILPLIFALATIFFPKNKNIIFWQILALSAIITALPASPLFMVIQKIPVLDKLREPARWMLLGLFSLSILAGLGFDSWLNNDYKEIKKKIYDVFKWLSISALILISAINIAHLLFSKQIIKLGYLYFDSYIYSPAKKLPLRHYHQIISIKYSEIINRFIYYNPAIIAQIVAIIISLFVLRYFLYKKLSASTVTIAIIINVLLILPFYPFLISVMPASYLDYQPQTAEYIKKYPGKIFPFLQGQSEYEKLNLPHNPSPGNFFIFQSELMSPLFNLYHQISSIDIYDSTLPLRNAKLLSLIGSTRVEAANFEEESLNQFSDLKEKINIFYHRRNILDLLGDNYVISVYPLIEDEKFFRVNVATTTPYQIPFYIYKNEAALPLAFLAENVRYLNQKNLDDKVKIIVDYKNDFHHQTFIECDECLKNQYKTSFSGQIKITNRTNTKIEIEYKSDNNGWLIINQTFLPGWQAKIDNQKTEIYYANLVNQAIFVSSGKHLIVIEYKYPINFLFKNIKDILF